MKNILIDTDILIDIANNDSIAKTRLNNEFKACQPSISIITKMELIVGCRNKIELQHLDQFLKQFTQINLNKEISITAIQLIRDYNLSHGLLIPDALIAATALSQKMPLLSKNQKDYRFIQNLNLLSYP